MKSKIFALGMALLLALVFIPTIAVYANAIRVTVDGETVNFTNQQPVIVDGRTLVPVRGVFETMGFDVDWHPEDRQAVLSRGNDIIVLTIDSATFFVRSEIRTLDVPAQIINGSTMVPLRAVLESVGYNLDWDGETSTVVITSRNSSTTPNTQPPAQTDTLGRIRMAHPSVADEMSEWSAQLNMTIDEIFDYVRAATRLDYGFDYLIEGGMDVGELAARVGESSDSFMSVVHIAYGATRSVDVAHRWAFELGMTALDLVDYVFGGNNARHIADTLGVEWGEFTNVLAVAGTAIRSQ